MDCLACPQFILLCVGDLWDAVAQDAQLGPN